MITGVQPVYQAAHHGYGSMTDDQAINVSEDHHTIPFWRDERVLRAVAQTVSAILIIGTLIWVAVNFVQGAPAGGTVTVTATITCTPTGKLFVQVQVNQN